ncbi:accessory factor UbiK family protein [Marinobacterium arenosum]|uniref:accessory factor UbiK family protein n=1 Tax=Marinobacterium arenosum TaxID=2862496 RepID=UPI001C987987|nr:accessory factor UbiK family protein [Marinobacterium arenosum]MBY4676481.1 accessory factor UbiK family protein [Marinobacterium arenosum]
MINQKLIEGLSEQFSQLMQGQSGLPGQQELQAQIRSLLQASFSRMDLVTREEFDAQRAVLARTREKLDQLEQQLSLLEDQLAKRD